ncbi:MAG: S8 family serine peptidase [Fibrobacteres bacterium]|nr:S8 family serine peptidase [Fibrobacterota bacterium]
MQIRFAALTLLLLTLLPLEALSSDGGRYWVRFKPDYFNTEAKRQELHNRLLQNGFKPFRTSKWLNAVSGVSTPVERATIQTWPEVVEVRAVATFSKRDSSYSKNKTFLQKTTATESKYGLNLAAYELCNIPEAHNALDSITATQGVYGKGVKIAIFDAGFTLRHESIKHLLDSQIIAKRDYVRPLWDTAFAGSFDTVVENEPGDHYKQEEHGTSVLSLIAGKKDGVLYGVAPAASFILAKTELTYKAKINSPGDTSWEESEIAEEEDNWIAAVEWAVDTMGAQIISSSLGYRNGFTDGTPDYPNSWMDGKTIPITIAAESAYVHGAIVVKSMGNGFHNVITTLSAPADGKNTVAVGAVDANGVLAIYSSSGPTFDGRVKPDVLAPGHLISAAVGRTSQYSSLTGTSFAAPLAAGMLALAIQYDTLSGKNLPNDSLIQRIRKTAFSPAGLDTSTLGWGYGIMNAYSVMTGIRDSSITKPVNRGEILFRAGPVPVKLGEEFTFMGFTDNLSIENERTDTLKVSIFTLSGKQVVKLKKNEAAVGSKTALSWNMLNSDGLQVAPGIYLYMAEFKQKTFRGKVAVIR